MTTEGILDGYEDETDSAVVAITAFFGNDVFLCSGTLVAPDVVLTARHCVSRTTGEAGGRAVCGETTFTSPEAPDRFTVTAKPRIPIDEVGYYGVREVVLLPEGEQLCGDDAAILLLSEPVPAVEAEPRVPRVDAPAARGETYSAVGYGATSDAGGGRGIRHRRDDLIVACAAEGCGSQDVALSEWQGEEGSCQGDSGGPAFDQGGRVMGVVSRGASGCQRPIYEDVSAHGEWLKRTVVDAAAHGGYPPPSWATGRPTDPAYSAPVGEGCAAPGDCAANLCLDGYCTRPCTEMAGCPDGFVCMGDPAESICRKEPSDPPADEADTAEAGAAACATRPSGPTLPRPTPWFLCTGVAGVALLRRRVSYFGARRPRGVVPR